MSTASSCAGGHHTEVTGSTVVISRTGISGREVSGQSIVIIVSGCLSAVVYVLALAVLARLVGLCGSHV